MPASDIQNAVHGLIVAFQCVKNGPMIPQQEMRPGKTAMRALDDFRRQTRLIQNFFFEGTKHVSLYDHSYDHTSV